MPTIRQHEIMKKPIICLNKLDFMWKTDWEIRFAGQLYRFLLCSVCIHVMHLTPRKSKRKFAPIANIIAYGNRLCETPETVKLVLSFVCNLFFKKTVLRSYDYERYSRRNMLKTGKKILNRKWWRRKTITSASVNYISRFWVQRGCRSLELTCI